MPTGRPRIPLRDLTDDLAFEFTDVPAPILAHFLRRSAAIMCRQGDLAPREQDVRTVPLVEDYRLEPDPGDEIHAILGAVPVIMPGAVAFERVRRFRDEPSLPGDGATACWFSPPDTIHLRRFPGLDSLGLYRVRFSTAPGPRACDVDAALGREHRETLLEGARWLLHSTAGKPWSSPDLAELRRARFMSGIQAAKAHDLVGRWRGTLRIGRGGII
jgi:hypothetical protein